MALPQGINFRASSGYVTDPTDTTYEVGLSANYPRTTPQGNNVGWESAPTSSRDRSTSIDARLAGIHYKIGGVVKYRIDLPSPGTYNVRIAAGDAGSNNNVASELFDDATSLGYLATADFIASNSFKDAADTSYTSANWPGSNTAVSKVFSSTICRFSVDSAANSGGATVIAHVYVEAAGGGPTTHATSGALAAAGATVAGTAAHIAKHAASGVLAGSGATVAGSAARTRAHPASGVLAGGGASVAGTARHNAPHPTSGALAGGGAEIAGVADHAVPGGTHDTSGALEGGGAAVVGTAAHIAVHAASGVLAGSGAVVDGTAARVAAAVTHATSGALVGGGAVVEGVARGPDASAQETAYATPKRKREYRYDYSPAPVVESPIAQALAKAIEVKAEKSGVDRAEIEKTLRRVADLGAQQEAVTRQIEAEAREIEQARLVAEMQRLQDAEDAEVAEVLAMLL